MHFLGHLLRLRLLTLTFVLLLPATAAPADQPNSPSQRNKPYVLMIGLDGFRDDYAARFHAVNLLALQHRGSSSKRLIPFFRPLPSLISIPLQRGFNPSGTDWSGCCFTTQRVTPNSIFVCP